MPDIYRCIRCSRDRLGFKAEIQFYFWDSAGFAAACTYIVLLYCKMQKEQKQDTNNNKREKREKGIQDWLIAISF